MSISVYMKCIYMNTSKEYIYICGQRGPKEWCMIKKWFWKGRIPSNYYYKSKYNILTGLLPSGYLMEVGQKRQLGSKIFHLPKKWIWQKLYKRHHIAFTQNPNRECILQDRVTTISPSVARQQAQAFVHLSSHVLQQQDLNPHPLGLSICSIMPNQQLRFN